MSDKKISHLTTLVSINWITFAADFKTPITVQ